MLRPLPGIVVTGAGGANWRLGKKYGQLPFIFAACGE
jgi:hypothetical protein